MKLLARIINWTLWFLCGPWPFAIMGALLILTSTFVQGVVTFGEEQKLLGIQKDIIAKETERLEAQRSAQESNIQFDLAALQRSVVKYSVFQFASLQKAWQSAYAASLYSAVLKGYSACGRDVLAQIETLKVLRSKAIEGDEKSLQKLGDLNVELSYAAGEHAGNLIVEKAKLEKTADKVRQSIITKRKWTFFFQILGLVLLLAKELPEKIWGKKNESNTV